MELIRWIQIKNTITRPDEAWVADITYLRTCEGFSYLFLVTDLYSRKILGHYVSQSLNADGTCIALKRAFKQSRNPLAVIHHSDQGFQYRSQRYTALLQKHNAIISMTGVNHCYDNAVAERINGILKHEFGLSGLLVSNKAAATLAAQSIDIYNNERPHLSLNYRTPEEVYAA